MTNRRSFLKATGLAGIPLLLAPRTGFAESRTNNNFAPGPGINFVTDCDQVSPQQYAEQLLQLTTASKELEDFYGNGGSVAALEKAFAAATGKEKAIYMPSGTMANQLAIKALSGDKPKIFVQETSHVYRDEADAAQAVHNKRLLPLAQGKAAFTLAELKEAAEYHKTGEYLSAAVGAVSIENPVRRADGAFVPLSDIKEIAAWCKTNNWPLHLDGARLHIASAWSGVSIKEYASYFDTVYISLYKYLGAAGGAILCGNAAVIDPMQRLVKIHGGTMLHVWPTTAIALHYLQGVEERWAQSRQRGDELIALLNKSKEFEIRALPNGTNIYNMRILAATDVQKFRKALYEGHQILLGRPGDKGLLHFYINDSILKKSAATISEAMVKTVRETKK